VGQRTWEDFLAQRLSSPGQRQVTPGTAAPGGGPRTGDFRPWL